MQSPLYSTYTQFKAWGADSAAQSAQISSYFPKLNPETKVLEVGFGSGVVLRWLRDQGVFVEGVEIIPELRAEAQNQGFTVYSDLSEVDGSVDLIVLIDVMEHLSLEEICRLFAHADRLLSETGIIVARFPNGASPFSAYYQAGDATHLKALSAESLGQMAQSAGFTVALARNSRFRPSSRKRWIQSLIVYMIRDIVECLVGYVYYGKRIPLDPNVLVYLKRSV